MKYALFILSLIIISWCSIRNNTHVDTPHTSWSHSGNTHGEYYAHLRAECEALSKYERGGCKTSVEWMEKNNYKESLSGSCPKGTIPNINKTIGSKRWCEAEKYTITKDSSGNTLLITPSGGKNICPPGMYPKWLDGCVKDLPKCEAGKTLTGSLGTQFCEATSENTSSWSAISPLPSSEENCKKAWWTYDRKFSECTNITEVSCKNIGGKYENCGSACRHDSNAKICTENCAIYCKL